MKRWLLFILGLTAEVKEPPLLMTDAEAQIIRQFAGGQIDLRKVAILAHECFMRRLQSKESWDYYKDRPPSRDNWPLEQKFMAEIDHPCPDGALREYYRKKLLKLDKK